MYIKTVTTEINNISFVFIVANKTIDLASYIKENYDDDLFKAVNAQLQTIQTNGLKNILQFALGDNIYLVSKEDVADNVTSLYAALCHCVYNDPRFNKEISFDEFFESGELMYLVHNIMH